MKSKILILNHMNTLLNIKKFKLIIEKKIDYLVA